MAAVDIEDVTKVYPGPRGQEDVIALEDISLEIKDKEFFTILGPSGCGKTTLLQIIDGVTGYDQGSVLLDDVPVTGSGRDRGMVFQNFNLLPWRTVYENVKFGLEIAGTDDEEQTRIADRFIELVGLDGFSDHYPHELSGGMQQRVGIARALAIDPGVLLMDEPFGALDAQTREFLQNELLRIWEQQKKTVVFITHNIEESIYLSDRIAVLSARPGMVREVVDVPFDRPRYNSNVKSTPEFNNLRDEIWDMLKTDVGDVQAED